MYCRGSNEVGILPVNTLNSGKRFSPMIDSPHKSLQTRSFFCFGLVFGMLIVHRATSHCPFKCNISGSFTVNQDVSFLEKYCFESALDRCI